MTRHGKLLLCHMVTVCSVRMDRQDFMVSPLLFKPDFSKCLVIRHGLTFALSHGDSPFDPYRRTVKINFHGIPITI